MATQEVSDVLIAEVFRTTSRAEGMTQSLEEDSSSSSGQTVSEVSAELLSGQSSLSVPPASLWVLSLPLLGAGIVRSRERRT